MKEEIPYQFRNKYSVQQMLAAQIAGILKWALHEVLTKYKISYAPLCNPIAPLPPPPIAPLPIAPPPIAPPPIAPPPIAPPPIAPPPTIQLSLQAILQRQEDFLEDLRNVDDPCKDCGHWFFDHCHICLGCWNQYSYAFPLKSKEEIRELVKLACKGYQNRHGEKPYQLSWNYLRALIQS